MTLKLARRTRIVASSVLVLALGLTACSANEVRFSPQSSENTLNSGAAESIGSSVESAMTLSQSSSAIVGVWDGEGELVQGFGDVEGGARFRGAQTTQPFMCALLLQEAKRGVVALDDEVQNDLPRQTNLGSTTYAQLCTGRSGLADFTKPITDDTVNNPTRVWPEQELIAEAMPKSPRPWPGKNFQRSDTNAVVLGRALSVVTGESLSELLEGQVFDVADMGGTYYPRPTSLTSSDDTMVGMTYPSRNGKPACKADIVEVPEVSPSMLAGAGGTITTARDIKNFYDRYFTGGFGNEQDAGLMTTVAPTKNPKRDDDGNPVGEPEVTPEEALTTGTPMWGFGTEKVGPLYGNYGSMPGTISAAYHDPDSGYTVVVALNNSSSGGKFAKALALEIAAISGVDVPWSNDDQVQKMQKLAACQ